MSIIPLPSRIQTMYMEKPNLQIYYPVTEELVNKQIERKVNNEILKQVNNLIIEQGYDTDPEIEIMGSYEIKTNERNILSLILINHSYSGGAHGYTIIKPLTFDMLTGNVISLEDLFKSGSDYMAELSKMVQRQIVEREIPTLGTFNSIRPDQDYYLSDKSLVLFFQLYELAPYAQGFVYFPISVYSIKDLIGQQSILRRMTTFY